MLLDINGLPAGDLDPAALTVVCDPDPDQALPRGGASQLFCADTARLGIRAMATLTGQPVSRIYIQRPVCPALPCFDAELDSATVTAWTDAGSTSFAFDIRQLTIPTPTADPAARWPSLSMAAPSVDRPVFKGAPHVLATRTPYPFCGTTTDQGPPDIANCFLSGVLEGRPVEMVDRSFGIEGGMVISIYRFDGAGAIHSIVSVEHRWIRVDGGVIINPGGAGWSFDSWADETSLN